MNKKKQKYDTDIEKYYAVLSSKRNFSWIERLECISAFFLGMPYILGACGEGAEGYFDQGPLYRTDGFDCVTFVNTVIAMARAVDLDSFKKIIEKINYRLGVVAYQNRFHFMSADWNLENEQQGFIKDITTLFTNAFENRVYEIAETIIDRT